MAPRKSAGKKKGGKGGGKGSKGGKAALKKRKQWDDYDATAAKAAKRKRVDPDDNEYTAAPTKKPKRNGDVGKKSTSMFGQWRDKKISQRKKERQFGSKTDAKKAAQRAQLTEQKRRRANAAYGGNGTPSRHAVKEEEEEEEESGVDESDHESEEEETTTRGKRHSVFDQFVQAFQPSTLALEEEEDEEEEGEYEEIEVDEDGNPIEEEEEEDEADHTDMDAGEEMEDATNAVEEEEEEEEEILENDDAEDMDSAAFDPYRQRFLLTEFNENDAKRMETSPRKFVPLTVDQALVPASLLDEFQVSFRHGLTLRPQGEDTHALQTLLSPSLNIRSRLLQTWKSTDVDPNAWRTTSPLEFTLFQQFASYADVFFAGQTQALTRPLRRLTAMHALNHVTKSRDTIARNNERLRKRETKDTEAEEEEDKPADLSADDEKEYRDQGFCRATVLILMPLRSAASQFVTELLALLPSTVTMFHNKDRFFSEFGTTDDDPKGAGDEVEEEDEEDLKEWQRVFAQGNNDDSFQIGISISRRGVRFYSDYRQADIIIASPLGLRQQLGDEVVDVAETQTLSSDFLSSIEVCVLDSASLLLMQNVEHVRHVLQALNVKPKEAPHADFSRLREWNLSFLGAYFRQTIVLAHGVEPMLQNLVNKCCTNHAGVIKYVRNYDSHTRESYPSITRVVPQIKQIFQRMDLSSGRALALTATDEVELRFEYFEKHIFTPLLDNPRRHVLIFVPSYFDYVRIRNLFHETMNEKLIRTVQCCEYTTPKQVSRARTSFFHGRCHVMLFTERFHFYHQYQLRGIHQIVWYGLPVMGDFYPEMLNMLEDTKRDDTVQDEGKSSIALYTRHDLFRLQRIVGGKRAERMCQNSAKKATFLFC